MLRVRQFRADKPPSSCTNLWYLIRLNQTERAQRITFKVPLCLRANTESPFGPISKELTSGQRSILEKHHGPSITSWLLILDSWQGNCMAICDVTTHSEWRAKQLCTHERTHTHMSARSCLSRNPSMLSVFIVSIYSFPAQKTEKGVSGSLATVC